MCASTSSTFLILNLQENDPTKLKEVIKRFTAGLRSISKSARYIVGDTQTTGARLFSHMKGTPPSLEIDLENKELGRQQFKKALEKHFVPYQELLNEITVADDVFYKGNVCGL